MVPRSCSSQRSGSKREPLSEIGLTSIGSVHVTNLATLACDRRGGRQPAGHAGRVAPNASREHRCTAASGSSVSSRVLRCLADAAAALEGHGPKTDPARVAPRRGEAVDAERPQPPCDYPVNAMLNYAYAVLESQVRIAAVSQGLDPTIGYLHSCQPGRAALVYDLLDTLRPQVDRLILSFALSHSLAPNDYHLSADGVCQLHPLLAR